MIGLFGIVDAFLRWMDEDDYDNDGNYIPEAELPIRPEPRNTGGNRMK